MCGICGKHSSNGVQRDEIEVMNRHLVHRGPDDEGVFLDSQTGLGHRRLSIIDLGAGQQPISNEDESIWIVCNGEIYNYQQLRSELIQRGHRFKTSSDTETILHLYEEQGEQCVKSLRGMFAFAIWDGRKRRLFAARDPLGQKPFYYVHRNHELVFASEIKALAALEPSLKQLDLAALDEYLTLRVIAAPRSIFRDIRKLPPAHYLTFDLEKGLHLERYWQLEYEPKFNGKDEDLVDELESRLIDCLRLHMVSDVPVGAFMSGGLDSTLIVAMLAQNGLAEDLPTFTVGLPYGQFDEAPTARLVAKHNGTRHHEETLIPKISHVLPQLVAQLDEPSDALSACMDQIARMASQHVKVVLGGDGGDELFGGYDRYYGNRYANYYAAIPRWIRRCLVQPLLQRTPEGGWYKSRGHQIKWLHEMSFFQGGRRYVHGLGYFYFPPSFKTELYGPVMRDAWRQFDAGFLMRNSFDRACAKNIVDRMLYADLQSRLPDHPVMIQDRMTMAHGLEARSPFLDHKLAEFAARLPVRLKVRGRSPRYIQHQLAKRYLPQEVLARKKQGFSSALPYLLKNELNSLYGVFLEGAMLASDGVLMQPAINRLLDEHRSGKSDHGNRLWLLLNSEVWYRMFIHGYTQDELSVVISSECATNSAPESEICV